MNHQIDHGETDHGFAGFGEGFIVFRQAAVFSKPCKCSFHDPPLGKDDKLVRVRSFNDFNDPAIPAGRPEAGLTGLGLTKKQQDVHRSQGDLHRGEGNGQLDETCEGHCQAVLVDDGLSHQCRG